LGSKPKTRTGNEFPKAKAKDLTFKVKAKDLASEAEVRAKDLTFEAKAMSSRTPTLVNIHVVTTKIMI